MLKTLYHQVVFSEIPDEVSLGISISGCQIHCKGCHSRELWEDKGSPLTIEELDKLIAQNQGISCLLLMGGEREIETLTTLFAHVYNSYTNIKTAWYCGLDQIPQDKLDIMQFLNYVKIGHYDPELGPLTSPTTNQKLYQVEYQSDRHFWLHDITNKLQTIPNNEN